MISEDLKIVNFFLNYTHLLIYMLFFNDLNVWIKLSLFTSHIFPIAFIWITLTHVLSFALND